MTAVRSDRWLSVFLLLALCSNATLLLILTFNAFHDDGCSNGSRNCAGHLQHACGCPTHAAPSEQNKRQDIATLGASLTKHSGRFRQFRNGPEPDPKEYLQGNTGASPDALNLRTFLRYKSLQDDQVQQGDLREKTFAQGSEKTGEDELNSKVELFSELHRQLSQIVRGQLLNPRSSVEGRLLNLQELSGISQEALSQEESILRKSREKRDTALSDLKAGADGTYLNYEFQFSKLAENRSLQLEDQMSDIIIPGLISFEERMIKHVEELHFTMLSHDLRLERMERALINLAKGPSKSSPERRARPRRGDQLLAPVSSHELRKLANGSRDITIFFNSSQALQGNASVDSLEELEDESNGDSDINSTTAAPTTTTTSTTSTTTTTTTTTEPIAFYDLQRDMQEMKHKVLALENYNTMSDSELTRVRSEVTRMDDKVIEMGRIQKNANSVTGQHTYKINELEMVINRNNMALSTTIEAYSRLNTRVGEFRDRLTDFEREMHGVTTHFSKHEQISNELRSADSYKAHDIMEIRKAMVNIETRINEMYNVMDQRIESVHTNVRDWYDRLCFNNKLAC
ncbi:hypothetical protein EGW08_023038 [Elysia chlorotica]|uniref:Uncharacterized protein n=1 Tax=Elysia chlorotica TaxID=188477 RepID=A0A3S0ZK12_ELYCH|nr:hypothetical protein EGW08_023038 [Elysia chlorotica]